jgi:hypothetical protein
MIDQKSESNRLIDLVQRLRNDKRLSTYIRSMHMKDGFDPSNITKVMDEAADTIEAQVKRIVELEDAFREIYEVYAGSEGFIPETCAEGYQQQLIKEMSDIAAKYMRKGLGEKE